MSSHRFVELPRLSRRHVLSLAALATPLASVATSLGEQSLRRLVVPVEPGGGIDFVARLLAKGFSEHGLPAAVVNRPGASGLIGTASVASAKPDGLTLLVTGVSHLTSPLLYGTTAYDPVSDFVPSARLATAPNVLLVGATLKGLGMADVLRHPRNGSRGFSYASAGYGHTSHLAAEVFMAQTGVSWLHVPFKGTAPAIRALLAGEVDVMFAPMGSVTAPIATGRVTALAIAHHERSQMLRDTPTLRELGVANAEFSQWYAVLAPKATPSEAVQAVASIALLTFRDSMAVSQLRDQGMEPAAMGSEQFAGFLLQEYKRLSSLIKNRQPDRPTN